MANSQDQQTSDYQPMLFEYRDVIATCDSMPKKDVHGFRKGDQFQLVSQTTDYPGWAVAKINNQLGFVRMDQVQLLSTEQPGGSSGGGGGGIADGKITTEHVGQKWWDDTMEYKKRHTQNIAEQYEILNKKMNELSRLVTADFHQWKSFEDEMVKFYKDQDKTVNRPLLRQIEQIRRQLEQLNK